MASKLLLSPSSLISAGLSHPTTTTTTKTRSSSTYVLRCSSSSSSSQESSQEESDKKKKAKRTLSRQSSWEATDALGNDYLLRLGTEADNVKIAVGARQGLIDDLFVGTFLGRDSDIIFDSRQKATRSFHHLQGDDQ